MIKEEEMTIWTLAVKTKTPVYVDVVSGTGWINYYTCETRINYSTNNDINMLAMLMYQAKGDRILWFCGKHYFIK